MKKQLLTASLFVALFASAAYADTDVGVVDFKECVEKSKHGQEERQAFEALKKQMTSSLEETDKELAAIAKKLEDQDYMDSLSPSAVEDLKLKFQQLSQEFARNQNQYFQMMQQANFRMMQQLHGLVAEAAEEVRQEKNLDLVLSQDALFAYADKLEITEDVIDEMDKSYKGKLSKKEEAPLTLPREEA